MLKHQLKRHLAVGFVVIVGVGLIVTTGLKINQIKSAAQSITKATIAQAAAASNFYNNDFPATPSGTCADAYASIGDHAKADLLANNNTYYSSWRVKDWLLILGKGIGRDSNGNYGIGDGIIGPSSWTVVGAINSSGSVSCYGETWRVEQVASTGTYGLSGKGIYTFRHDQSTNMTVTKGSGGTFATQAKCPALFGPWNSTFNTSSEETVNKSTMNAAVQSDPNNALCEWPSDQNNDATINNFSQAPGNTDNGPGAFSYYSATNAQWMSHAATYIPTTWLVSGRVGN